MQTQTRIPFTLDDYLALVVEAKTHTLETESGNEVNLFTTIATGTKALVGQQIGRDWIDTWYADGRYEEKKGDSYDLTIVKKAPKSLGWINVYDYCRPTNRREADANAYNATFQGHVRVACIEVFEGQGLEEPTSDETK